MFLNQKTFKIKLKRKNHTEKIKHLLYPHNVDPHSAFRLALDF